MRNSLESALVTCPYCGETIDLLIDCSLEQQEYIEDCSVCCRPITVNVDCSREPPAILARRDDEC
jgi:hypothetical protein